MMDIIDISVECDAIRDITILCNTLKRYCIDANTYGMTWEYARAVAIRQALGDEDFLYTNSNTPVGCLFCITQRTDDQASAQWVTEYKLYTLTEDRSMQIPIDTTVLKVKDHCNIWTLSDIVNICVSSNIQELDFGYNGLTKLGPDGYEALDILRSLPKLKLIYYCSNTEDYQGCEFIDDMVDMFEGTDVLLNDINEYVKGKG